MDFHRILSKIITIILQYFCIVFNIDLKQCIKSCIKNSNLHGRLSKNNSYLDGKITLRLYYKLNYLNSIVYKHEVQKIKN